jgi:serine/threonine-protein kinase
MLPESTAAGKTMTDDDAAVLPSDPDRTASHDRPESERAGSTSASRFTPGTMLAGRYRIVAPLGSGGVGEVYRAEDTKLGQTVALKFIAQRIAHDRTLLERIVAEVRIGRQVSHPNLCRIYDMGEIDDQHFITMEYVDGENLASLLRRVGWLPEDKALDVAREIGAALAEAHDHGVVHRDVKPANVMIDGRGHARITDFGLAIISGQTASDSFAGTPAYMAPEQLHGAEATEQSDIYSLGLLLYEIFTGQRVFSGTLTDILSAHAQAKRPPSTITRGLSPAVERVILQCIEESPSNRPESVRDVLAALPARDPLRAAIAAGETPSPGAVAAAEAVGNLPLATAWTAVATMLLLLIGIGTVSRYTMLYRQAPLTMSPDVLTDRARHIIRAAGYDSRRPGSRRWIGKDVEVLKTAAASTSSAHRSAIFQRISPLRFGYRESPLALVPHGRGTIVTEADPPFTVPGMITVVLDSRGQLVRFMRAPTAGPAAAPQPPNWAEFFEFAGLKQETLSPTAERWVSPVDQDAKQSWSGVISADPPLTVNVRAASHAGKPVFFETALQPRTPAQLPRRQREEATATEHFTAVAGFAGVFLAGLVLAAVVARRNIRLGRGDRAAARKVSLLVLVSFFVAGLLSADHTSNAGGEWGLLVGIAGNALYNAGATWLFYIAAEPYVRRRQPELLISWNRVMRGYLRDALVGRHVLLGCLLGAVMNLFYAHLLVLVPEWLGMTPPLPNHAFPEKLAGGVWPLVSLASLLGSVPLQSLLALFIFSAVRSVFRNDWLAAAVVVIVSAIPYIGRDTASRAEAPFVICAAAVFVFALCRLGLLAGVVTLFAGSWLNISLFVFDTRSWLFGPSLIYLSVTLALVIYGFRYSLGPSPLLGRVRLAD